MGISDWGFVREMHMRCIRERDTRMRKLIPQERPEEIILCSSLGDPDANH